MSLLLSRLFVPRVVGTKHEPREQSVKQHRDGDMQKQRWKHSNFNHALIMQFYFTIVQVNLL